uniref:Uncharacterized protein n=1 Tax=Chromera velia CCMP2878 TaxID=1169474 RepID=A0A0G4F7W2_9ALVE|eukprot:Cvel_15674.t1-p1 / transcript=Cvel_15674.t1 / gene=Cvel_15674 / organism=Chromera_velia_CCMP2878 / gene_product=hypothetical protein / transcript_product=hypothetical protein / location=Cvel_scaffold1170:20759-21547(-) / protein_length=263 / sequence_SO=supercontig / SO=protein_coding / is_pseudo=false
MKNVPYVWVVRSSCIFVGVILGFLLLGGLVVLSWVLVVVALSVLVCYVLAFWLHWSRDRRGANRILALLKRTIDGNQRKAILTNFDNYWSASCTGCTTCCREFVGGLCEARALYALNAWVYYKTGVLLCDASCGEISELHERVVLAVRQGIESDSLRGFVTSRTSDNRREIVIMTVCLADFGGNETAKAVEAGQMPTVPSIQAMSPARDLGCNPDSAAVEVRQQMGEQTHTRISGPALKNGVAPGPAATETERNRAPVGGPVE